MEQSSSDCVQLGAACVVLSESRAVQAMVKKAVGAKDFPAALALMKAGTLEGDLGDTIHDLLSDAIENEATEAWRGFTHHPHGDYPLVVNEYHGVYWVYAMEFDPVGYFLDEFSAVGFARSNWDNVYDEGEVPDDDDEEMEDSDEVRCPFCRATENCDHLLLVVDLTLRKAESGPLFETFNSKWSAVFADKYEDEDFDEADEFEGLVGSVKHVADSEIENSPSGAPEMSSTYVSFFCSTKRRIQAAIKKFSKV